MARIAFDIELMRPGCALLQAVFGCESALAQRFPTESWLLAPTEHLRVYAITDEQLDKLVDHVRRQLIKV